MYRSYQTTWPQHLSAKRAFLQYSDNREIFALLDSNGANQLDRYSKYDLLLACEPKDVFQLASFNENKSAWVQLSKWSYGKPWVFGILSYDCNHWKKSNPHSTKNNPDWTPPDMLFFEPSIVCCLKEGLLQVQSMSHNPQKIAEYLIELAKENLINSRLEWRVPISSPVSKIDYLQKTSIIQSHILEGDSYEINYCIPFEGKVKIHHPWGLYERLSEANPNPFGGYFKAFEHHLMCFSPERFLCSRGNLIAAQPIKGTRKRSINQDEHHKLIRELQSNTKDKAEHIMIVDLLRNDLSQSCIPGSVKVEELFGIYSFKYVIQMISTITGNLRHGVSPLEALAKAFPMGSMTGAPKIRSIEIIEENEVFRRSWFSGSLGYIDPDGDMDFNVIIRSILYNECSEYISIPAGGAIVFDSDPEKEYEEVHVKAGPIIRLLEQLD